MKLSLISIVTNEEKDLGYYLKSLEEQTSQDFEIILCLSNTSQRNLDLIKELVPYQLKFGPRLKYIYNSKQNNAQEHLLNAYRVTSGEYSVVFNTDISVIKNTYIEKMIQAIDQAKVDILEFKPRINGSIFWKPQARVVEGREINLKYHKLVFAYTYPFIFNKIIKKSLSNKMLNYKFKTINNNKMCLELTYMLFLEAKTYMYLDYKIFREYFPTDIWLNTKNYVSVFDNVQSILEARQINLIDELLYAKYYFVKLLLTAFLTETKFMYRNIYKTKEDIAEKRNDKIFENHLEIIKKMELTYKTKDYFLTNPYFLRNNSEVALLSTPVSKLKNLKILKKLS
ncbi:glycosyl transferase [Mycoplasmopsis bovirhinis]|uniref:glycosyltransferase n=1 Tax=Mycoplasmopsis bovirhinis TaxID=29553 RepID=UPI000C058367|nr:glycosyltransferase [Mycoplasmopsis bovirhinis]ATO30908.1 glycosyl transferase [Mycoplasmopsis bovirhinis]